MKTSDKSEKSEDSRQRDSSPRPQTQTKAKKRARAKTTSFHFVDRPEVDRVKRYFIGKELQKVWQKVSYTGRQRIVKHYGSLSIIITEAELEEPLPDEDYSLPACPIDLEEEPAASNFEFQPQNNGESMILSYCESSEAWDFSELLRDPEPAMSPTERLVIELVLDHDRVTKSLSVEPVFDFFEFVCDDTWSKVGFCEAGRAYHPALLQRELDQAHDVESDPHEQHA